MKNFVVICLIVAFTFSCNNAENKNENSSSKEVFINPQDKFLGTWKADFGSDCKDCIVYNIVKENNQIILKRKKKKSQDVTVMYEHLYVANYDEKNDNLIINQGIATVTIAIVGEGKLVSNWDKSEFHKVK
jgi:hypothetical protein